MADNFNFFELSRDTKFSIRTLTSLSVFIIAVFGFNLKIASFIIDYGEKNNSLCFFSLFVLLGYLIITAIYYIRDIKTYLFKLFEIKNDAKNIKNILYDFNKYKKNNPNEVSLYWEYYKGETKKEQKYHQMREKYLKDRTLNDTEFESIMKWLNLFRYNDLWIVIFLNGIVPFGLAICGIVCILNSI